MVEVTGAAAAEGDCAVAPLNGGRGVGACRGDTALETFRGDLCTALQTLSSTPLSQRDFPQSAERPGAALPP